MKMHGLLYIDDVCLSRDGSVAMLILSETIDQLDDEIQE